MRRYLLLMLVCLLSVAFWIPLWMLLTGSMMGEQELIQNLAPILKESTQFASWPVLPQYPTLQPYVELLLDSPGFFAMFWNSVSQVFPILLLQVCIGAPAAWCFAQFSFRGKRIIYLIYILLMLLPFQVTMVSNYLILDRLHLMNTIWAVILSSAFSTFPVFIMTRFFSGVPASLIEAASLDGASPWQTFLHIGLPLGAPGILATVVLGFIEYWNSLEQPLAFLQDKTLWPLSLYLPNITANNAGVSLVASVVMLAPSLLIFLFGQKYLEQGISASGLKD